MTDEPFVEPPEHPTTDDFAPPVDDGHQRGGLRDRLGARGEEALGRIAQDLLENTWVNSALSAAFDARGRASAVQEAAMDLLNLPSAAHLERLTRRVRSVSQRLEGIEEALTRLEDGLRGAPAGLGSRLDAIEEQLAALTRMVAELHEPGAGTLAVSRDQERLRVEEAGHDARHQHEHHDHEHDRHDDH